MSVQTHEAFNKLAKNQVDNSLIFGKILNNLVYLRDGFSEGQIPPWSTARASGKRCICTAHSATLTG